MKRTIWLFLLVSTSVHLFSQDNATLIAQSFSEYRQKVMDDNIKEAVNFLDSHTYQYFKDLLHHIIYSDSITLESISSADKFSVLFVRHVASKKEILSFNEKTLMIYTMGHGLLGKSAFETLSLGKVTVKNNSATAPLLDNGKKSGQTIRFYFEANKWKIDLSPLLTGTDKEMQKVLKDTGKSENEFMLGMLELMSEKKPSPAIWKKLK